MQHMHRVSDRICADSVNGLCTVCWWSKTGGSICYEHEELYKPASFLTSSVSLTQGSAEYSENLSFLKVEYLGDGVINILVIFRGNAIKSSYFYSLLR